MLETSYRYEIKMNESNRNLTIEAKSLKVYFPVTKGIISDKVIAWIKALDGIDLSITKGQIVGIVGESGSGKTTLAKIFLLLEKATEGKVLFNGKDLYNLNKKELKEYRQSVQAVFQDPFASLSPRLKIKEIIAEPIIVSKKLSKNDIEYKVADLLRLVGLDPILMEVFPHELSGGQRQRIAIARALSTGADLIILDEPTSALDVSVRLQIINLLMDIQKQMGLGYLLIGHDLAMVSYMSTHIGVMYLGRIMEFSETKDLLKNTFHPYTKALFSASLPTHPKHKKISIMLSGEIPNPIDIPSGCRFYPRCLEKKLICTQKEPSLLCVGDKHLVACHLYTDE